MASGSLSWLVVVPLGVGALFGFALAAWALLWDRARGRRRCPRCWYDMSHAGGLQCSECGFVARRVRALHRTRRRWEWAALGVLAMLGAGAGFTPKVRRDGWLSIVPTTALVIASVDGEGRLRRAAEDELLRRKAVGDLWDWQWRLVLREQIFDMPRRWPAGRPLPARIEFPKWAVGCALTFQHDDRPPVEFHVPRNFCGNSTREEITGFSYVDVTTPERAGEALQLSIRVNPGMRWWNVASGMPSPLLWEGPVTLPVMIVDGVEPVHEPVDDATTNASVQQATALGLSRGPLPGKLVILLDRSEDHRLAKLAVGYRIEWIRDGNTVDERTAALRRSEPATSVAVPPALRAWKTLDRAEIARWSLRVSGCAETAMYDWRHRRRWAGAFTVPLADVIDRTERGAPKDRCPDGSFHCRYGYLLAGADGR